MFYLCNAKTAEEFQSEREKIHNDPTTKVSMRVMARLWYKPDGANKSLVVEYQISTKNTRESINPDGNGQYAPDFFEAYEINADGDVMQKVLAAETVKPDINFEDLKDSMKVFAKSTFDHYLKSPKQEIRVKTIGGTLIAEQNFDPDYAGISIVFETEDRNVIDIVGVECKAETGQKELDIYSFEDVSTEDCTRKVTIKVADIYQALEEDMPPQLQTVEASEESIEDALVEKIANDSIENIEAFLGYQISDRMKDLTERIREVLTQMPEEEIQTYVSKYGISMN